MIDPARRIAKARDALAFGRFALTGGFHEEAGRAAYMGAFHAATAFIADRTGRTPKTHSGTRSEFARLARQGADLSHPPSP